MYFFNLPFFWLQDDSFSCVMKEMASHEFVPEHCIRMYFNDEPVEPFDTPATLGIGPADIIGRFVWNKLK